MRKRLAALSALTALALPATVGVVPATAAPASPAAAVDCTYTPVLPKLITVNKPTILFHTPVTITGTDCLHVFTASVSLTHGTDTYFLNWTQDSHTAGDSVFATTVVPGVYRTASNATCGVIGSDGSNRTCAVGTGSTVIKFASTTALSASRLTGSKKARKLVRFTVKTSRYNPLTKSYTSDAVSIQRYSKHAWHTIHKATAKGSKGYVWTYKDASAASYRAVSTATGTVLAATSHTVRR